MTQAIRVAAHSGPRGYDLRALEQLQHDGRTYARNCVLPHESFSDETIDRLIRTRKAAWVKPGAWHPEPRATPTSPPPAVRPPIQWVHDKDPETEWTETFSANFRVIQDAGVVEDMMLATPYGRDVYKRKTAVAAARQAEQRRADATRHLEQRLAARGV